MAIEDQVITIVNEICGAEDGELAADLNLFEAGLLDSFAVIQLVMGLEEKFSISLDMAVIPRERLATPLSIAALVRQSGGGA